MNALVAAALIIIGILALTTTLIGKVFLAIVALVAGVLMLAGVISSGAITMRRNR